MNAQLNVFIQVADCGSFSKAAEKLYISPTAVMKQMNLLETHVGVPLFIRTNHGIRLTVAGQSFYKDTKFMLKYSEEALLRARQTAKADQYVMRLGSSTLKPCKVLLDLWNESSDSYPQFRIKIVHFEDTAYTMAMTYRTIGKHFDFMVGLYDTANWKDYFNVLKLGDYRFCFAVSRKHRLAVKRKLSVTDLYGEQLIMVKRGTSMLVDEIRDDLMCSHPQIQIEDAPPHYDIDVFNHCEQSEAVLLTLDAWEDIHPSLVTIPSDLDYTIPFGLLYPINPSEGAKQFLEAVKNIVCTKYK